MKRLLCSFVLALSLLSSPAFAQEYKNATRLGGSTSFYKPALTSQASLQKMTQTTVADIRAVLRQSGVEQLTDEVVSALTTGRGVTEVSIKPGATIEWMAYRPHRHVDRLTYLKWAGKAPFAAFQFTVVEGSTTYTFIVPKLCGNLALLSKVTKEKVVEVVPPPVVVIAPPVVAPPPPVVAPPPVVVVEEKPRQPLFFVDALAGKERRTLAVPNYRGNASQCSPMIGFKLGVAKKFDNGVEVGAAGGVAISLVRDDLKTRQNVVFVDAEVNKYIGGSYVGAGVTYWDLTRDSSRHTGALAHFGIPFGQSKTYFVGEGRVFFNQLDNVDNNYQFWAGIRVKF